VFIPHTCMHSRGKAMPLCLCVCIYAKKIQGLKIKLICTPIMYTVTTVYIIGEYALYIRVPSGSV